MREFRLEPHVDSLREDALRAKRQRDTQRWREELRPRALRLFAARARNITWSRALLKLVVEELYPDDLFTELVGSVDRVPRRKWPRVIAIAVALRHSWRPDGLSKIATALHVSLAPAKPPARPQRRSRITRHSKRARVRRRPHR